MCFEFHKRTNKTTEHKQFNYNVYKQIQILLLLPKTFISFVFPIFWLWSYPMKVTPEICSAHYIIYLRIWWRLLQKYVLHTTLYIYVSDEGYSRNMFCSQHYISTFILLLYVKVYLYLKTQIQNLLLFRSIKLA